MYQYFVISCIKKDPQDFFCFGILYKECDGVVKVNGE